MNTDGNLDALRKHQDKQQSGEEQLEEGQELIETRLADEVIPAIEELIKEIEGLDFGLDGKDLVMEHLKAVL